MDPISSGNITTALILLSETETTHKDQINGQSAKRQQNYNKENDSYCPIFHQFYNNGKLDATVNMINFTPDKMEFIWNFIEKNVNISLHARLGKLQLVNQMIVCSWN